MGAVFSSLLSILDEYEQQDHTTNISVRENRLARLECAVSALNQALPLASGVSASAELRSFRQRVNVSFRQRFDYKRTVTRSLCYPHMSLLKLFFVNNL